MRLLLSRAHLLQERLEGDEAVIVSGVAQLLHQVLGLLLGQLLTEVHQQLEQLQDLNEVVEASLGDSTTDLLDGLQGWVQVAGTDKVANVEGVNLAISLEVIDVK